ncbi:MAG TPA: hypothetical protein VMT15_19385 [Bryobacteraceae bacterium]|nr:hypothetical protein [Bryobacteraceae bacterium]
MQIARAAHPSIAPRGRVQRASPPGTWLAPTAIATEIDPGPTVSGIVNG